ncbi:ABC transporter ATP-binding protein [Methanooceanicella nereidis]|uniref:ABC transporter ATP-binding protein n=1 Tax=Methanooceanicella nereidis TaxID=2052831 RepID=UPI001E3ED564|nr:ABC transporter ATP-binding protein [Methanocella sp. CWC-04]
MIGVSKKLGEFSLKDIRLEIGENEYFMILGPSGTGKTILLETIAGIYQPDSGNIMMNGIDITRSPPRDRRIGMVYQDFMLFPHLSVLDNIAFGLRSYRASPDETRKRVEECAELLNISGLLHRYPATLSGGERQRTAIARALVIRPGVLLLDEPLSALDVKTRYMLQEELKKIHKVTGTTIVHITHNFEEVFSLADRIAVMDNGAIVQVGKPDEIFRRPGCAFTAGFVGMDNVVPGESRIENDMSIIRSNGMTIVSTVQMNGTVNACIRPEDILISKTLSYGHENVLAGKVERVINNGPYYRVIVHAGVQLTAILTRREVVMSEIKEGATVYLSFSASDVHVF